VQLPALAAELERAAGQAIWRPRMAALIAEAQQPAGAPGGLRHLAGRQWLLAAQPAARGRRSQRARGKPRPQAARTGEERTGEAAPPARVVLLRRSAPRRARAAGW